MSEASHAVRFRCIVGHCVSRGRPFAGAWLMVTAQAPGRIADRMPTQPIGAMPT